jgi:hypothetical protein
MLCFPHQSRQSLITPFSTSLGRVCYHDEDSVLDYRRTMSYSWNIQSWCKKRVEIETKLGHPKTTIYTVLKRFEYCRIVEGQKSRWRPWKLSERSIKIVTRALATDCKQTLVDITNRSGFYVSTSNVRKDLHEVGFYNRVA